MVQNCNIYYPPSKLWKLPMVHGTDKGRQHYICSSIAEMEWAECSFWMELHEWKIIGWQRGQYSGDQEQKEDCKDDHQWNGWWYTRTTIL